MFNNTKNIFLFILLTFVASSCDDTDATEQDGHTDADGMEIVEMVGEEEGLLYSECQGEMLNNFAAGIPSGNEWDLTVHFLNDECEELEHDDDDHEGHDHGDDHGDDEPYLEITGYDSSIISITVGGHDDHGDDDHGDEEHCDELSQTECEASDHCEWHADDMACEESDHDDHGDDDHGDHDEEHGYTFELESLSAGTTTFTVTLMHQSHSDYTSQEITITVE